MDSSGTSSAHVAIDLAPTFSEHSYGFRPGRSAPQGVARAQQYVRAGYRWVVDFELEKFGDRVNHARVDGAPGPANFR